MDVKYQVFISSTYNDLKEERQEVIKVVLQMGHIPVSMEFFSAADEDQWSLIKGLLDECDYYVVIIGGIYGSIEEKSGKSYTQLEYEYAVEKGIPVIGILNRDVNSLHAEKRERKKVNQEKLAGFSELVKRKMCQFWSTPSDLASNVATSLHKLMNKNPRLGWTRVLPKEHPIEEVVQTINVDIPKPKNVVSNEIITERDIRKVLKKGLFDFGSFIEIYFIIEGLYSHSNTETKLPNSQLEWIRKNEIPAHLQQVNEVWTRSYRCIHTFINIRDLAQKRGVPQDVISIGNIFISYIYYVLTEVWGDVPYFNNKPELVMEPKGSSNVKEIRELSLANLQSVLQDSTLSTQHVDLAGGVAVRWELQAKNYSKAKAYIDKLINRDRYKLASVHEIFSTDVESIGYFDTDQEDSQFHNPVFKVLCKKGRFVHYLRYTEVLLMAAEIYFHLSDHQQALYYINLVRIRNNQPQLKETGNNFIATLLDDWKANLGMEGSYFSALKRNGYAEKVLGIPAFKSVLPIPAQEIALNPNMQQNEGY